MDQRSKSELLEIGPSTDAWTKPQSIYKYSEYIHRDRHIFLGRTMFYENSVVGTPQLIPQQTHLPSLKRVQLSLDVVHNEPKYRFSESLNTYVDTRKRIRGVNSVDEYDRRTSTLTLPSLSHKNSLGGVLTTTPIRRPCLYATTAKPQGGPQFQTEETFWNTETESFQTGDAGTDSAYLVPCMPTRFWSALRHFPLLRQKTDSLLVNKRNHKVRF